MRINKCKISIATRRENVGWLQHEASSQWHGTLQSQIAQRLDLWLTSLGRQEPVILQCLTLDIDALPRSAFSAQFAPRVIAALDKALSTLRLPEQQRVTAAADEGNALTALAPSPQQRPAVPEASPDPVARFLQFLRSGYWSPQLAEQQGAEAGASSTTDSPMRWLAYFLRQNEQRTARLWPELNSVLTLPQARRRLLSCLTAPLWPLWQQRALNLAQPAAVSQPPDAVSLLLLLWRRRIVMVDAEAPPITHFYAAEQLPPDIKQQQDIAALLRLADNPSLTDAQHNTAAVAVQQEITALMKRTGSSQQGNVQQSNTLPAADEAIAVYHAGVVLLWPLLPRWLSELGLLIKLNEQAPLTFSSPQAQCEAIALLDAVIWQDDGGGEWRSLVSKLLCGWPLAAPLEHWPSAERISELYQPLAEQLQSTLRQLQQLQLMQRQARPGLDKLTVRDMSQLFLQRSGTLQETRSGWQLSVNPHPADLLLWAIPWPLEQIIYPWTAGPIGLNWPLPVLPHTV